MKTNTYIIITVLVALIYGTFAGERRIFPYPQLIALKKLIKNEEPKSINYFYEQKRSHHSVLDSRSTASIVMLGDSLTDRAEWQELFGTLDVINRGIDGDTTEGILQRIGTLSPSVKKVFILAGTNDLNQNYSVQSTFDTYVEIIARLQQKNIEVYVQSTLLHTHLQALALNPKIDQLNHLLKRYCDDNKITYIDLNIHLSKNEELNEAYTIDGTHLNGDGYDAWSNSLSLYIKEPH